MKLMKFTRQQMIRMLCFICAVVVAFSCIPVSSVITDATAEEYLEQSLELYPDEKNNGKYITLNGVMPENASAEAVDVTAEYSELADHATESSVLAAYDISITGKKGDFQPIENKPIFVEIVDPKICVGCVTELWHITDDGHYEQVHDFEINDGKLSFYATGFSVYAIVNAPDPYVREYVTSVDGLTSPKAASGFHFMLKNSNYISSVANNKNCLKETADISKAAIWYFESAMNGYKLYTYVNGTKKYLHNIPSKNGTGISEPTEQVDVELSDTDADLIEMTFDPSDDSFCINKSDTDMYLQHSGSGGGIRYYKGNSNVNNTHIKISYADTANPPDDMYHLDGKTYGLMYYSDGTLGYGLMADTQNNAVDMTSLVVRHDHGSETLYVAQDCDISMWTLHCVSQNIYKLSAKVNGVTKYLAVNGNSLILTDDVQNAASMTLTPDSKNIMLSANGKSICFDGNSFSMKTTNANDTSQWLYLTKLSGLENDDYVCYSADKISVSDVIHKSMVIVYTRVWDDNAKKYNFYAVDYDGSLYPCYERGDSIMWVGSRVNTMQWEFIEYTYDDGSPRYYYELYNPYSKKFIAPQIKDGQVLSDRKIGINMPGRRAGEYYTDIIAWDDPYYAYAGLRSNDDNSHVISASRSKAETYYFAVVETPVPTLTTIETIDNYEFGIKMKMINFPDPSDQNSTMGTEDTTSKDYATKGLLSTNLDEHGYPSAVSTGISLSDLYHGANSVNHLFTESIYNTSGYFEFDSCQNFATLYNKNNELTTDFTVYKELGTTDNTSKSTLKHGQFFPYDTITAGKYSTLNPENLYGAVAVPERPEIGVLPESDPRKYEKLYTVGKKPNYYNGMEMEADFIQTPDGKDSWGHDIIFEFTGDDDFWLYVDGELIIDLGGIHSALAGSVNFATGDVFVEGKHTDLRELFKANYTSRYPNASPDEVNAYLNQHFKNGENIFKDYSPHTMKLFYMERGAGASNLHMRFNLSHVTPVQVMLTKNVTGSDDIDFNLVEYPFQIWYKDQQMGDPKLLTDTDPAVNVTYDSSTQKVHHVDTYTPPDSNIVYESVYFLNPGMTTNIHFPDNTLEYRIIECGINSEVYDHVYINGVETAGDFSHNTNRGSFDSGWQELKNKQSVIFENHVNSDALRTLSFKKVLYDQSHNELTAKDDPTTFSFRLYLSNGVNDTLTLANMYKYHVTDPDGYLCRWDVASQRFSATETHFSDIDKLTAEQKEQLTFETSMNGAISKIPAGYTVEVPHLVVGTKFMVVERNNDIPQGYKLISYERSGSTYFVAEGDPENIGWIRENDSPLMLINNKRGWGMKANKIWTDNNYASSHDPIYTAVYVGDKLVEGTVRKIQYPVTSVNYYFDELKTGTDYHDYSIYEVKVTEPVLAPDDQTVTSYTNLIRLNNGDMTKIGAVSKSTGIYDTFSYAVEYTRGKVGSTAPGLNNVKTDTITNIRTPGIVITLYDMNTREPLANGTFTLKQGETELGTFISDSDGRVTIMYDFIHNTDYTLTETEPPAQYIGLPNSAVFSVNSDDKITLSGNEDQWQSWHSPTTPDDRIIAYIDLFNKPYRLQVIKEDSLTRLPLGNAHFALYRSIQGIGGNVKDVSPVSGCDDLVTDTDGLVPFPDSTLLPGRYYLTEITPPPNYKPLDTDIIFTLSESGDFIINSEGHESFLTSSTTNEIVYSVHVPNTPLAELTVTKTVQGNFGNLNKEFTFTFKAENASDDGYEWSKNGVHQSNRLHSDDTFTLKHNDTFKVTLPKGTDVTISENSENYTASFKLGTANAENVSTKTFSLDDNITLAVTNTLNSTLPTGIKTGINILIFLMVIIGSLAAVSFIMHRKRSSHFTE